MNEDKTRKKKIKKLGISNKAIRQKDRVINLMVFTTIFFIALLMISQIV
ncbi:MULTISPECIES: hypothetical protein [Flavobacterium]|uniref:Uncharacterized protein n=1 Tax=Flavobacterium lipolyticum TaxID=2893754 RepID=A0ABS8M3I4_9FLAO|nr:MULTISPECIES: hypothetical protein [unclassified Flavobacterium]MCC9018887.1 hypothetical protein [Flavobacterium sp. F-126]